MKHSARSLLLLVLISVQGAAPGKALAQPPSDGAPAMRATYRDAALAFQRLDAQFMQRLADRACPPPEGIDADSDEWRRWTLADPQALRRLNADFDRATMAFFGGNLATVVQAMNAMMLERPGSRRDKAFADFARSLRLDIDPALPCIDDFADGNPAPSDIRARLTSIYTRAADAQAPEEFSLVVRDGDNSTSYAASPVVNESGGVEAVVRFMLPKPVSPGRRDVLLCSGPTKVPSREEPPRTLELIGRWTILPEPINETRGRLAHRLSQIEDRLESGDEPIALRLLRERIALLNLIDSHADITALLTDFAQLSADLDREAAAVAAGVNPYMGGAGDMWHGLPLTSDVHLPARIFVPESGLAKDAMPLLIALHGAGGNENMFIDGYGAGVITRLAEQHGFAVVSPLASPMMDLGLAFDTIVGAMKQLYSIDESRVYVIGHSLGAAMTSGICAVRGDRIAAACWLAGAGLARGDRIPPTLAVAGEIDPLIPPARIQAAVRMAQASDVEIEYRLVADFGHTLLVGYILPDVVNWLLTKQME